MYQIHDLSKACGISRKAIRLYEEKELLFPFRKDGERYYTENDFLRLHCICYYRNLGFSLAEIKQMFKESDSQTIHKTLIHHQKDLSEHIFQVQEQVKGIEEIIKRIKEKKSFDITTIDFNKDEDMVEGVVTWKLNNIYQQTPFRCSKRCYWHYQNSRRILAILFPIIIILVILERIGVIA